MYSNDFSLPLPQRCPLIEIPQFIDERGTLAVLEWEAMSDVAFPVQRAFWFYNVPVSANRGGHAHKTCKELVFAVSGSFEVELTDGCTKLNVLLNNPAKGLIIPEYVWCRLHNFSENSVGICLASEPYAPKGYFYDFEQYLEEVSYLKQNVHEL